MADLELSPPLFAILSSLIEERIGLSYTLRDQELLASKLSLRALELGFSSLLDYYYYLRYDAGSAAEFSGLVNALVVNETFFFRELSSLSTVVTAVVAPLVRAGHAPRIWSAACSTGEEPLTLAMLLDQHALLDKVELVATDISSNALARAQSGEHSRRSLRHPAAPALIARWLTVREHSVCVAPELRAAIEWKQLNLLDQEAIRALGSFDLILCRNVLIYFNEATTARVVHSLGDRLRPGGVLLVGVSESLLRVATALTCEETAGVFFYRKAVA
jgi:chemotaxis protein methyltransferase CheR